MVRSLTAALCAALFVLSPLVSAQRVTTELPLEQIGLSTVATGPQGIRGLSAATGATGATGPAGSWTQGTLFKTPIDTALGYSPLSVSSLGTLLLAALTQNNIDQNRFLFGDGTVGYTAAPRYGHDWISDERFAILGAPEFFPAADVLNEIQTFVATASPPSISQIPTGSICIFVTNNASPPYDKGCVIDKNSDGAARGYLSGYGLYAHHAMSEGIFALIDLEYIYATYYTGSYAQFTTDATTLDRALSAVPTDCTTGLAYVNPSDQWICFGFQEDVRFTGLTATCSMQLWQADTKMAQMAQATGMTALYNKYSAAASRIASNLGTSSALWDSADGMFYGATIQDKNIDDFASTMFCQYQIPTPNLVAQCSAISTYLAKNYATVFYKGYMRQSPTGWSTLGGVNADNSINPNSWEGHTQPDCYQDGYWSTYNRAAAETLSITSPAKAKQLFEDFQNTPDPTAEYLAPNCTTDAGTRASRTIWNRP